MGKSVIDLKVQVFKKYKNNVFQTNGKAKPISDAIYEVLIRELNGMTKKSIQTSINRNTKEILANQQVSFFF